MLAVTGSTGRLGGRVARRLAQTGRRDQRLLVSRPGRAPDLRGAEVRQAVYDDADAVAAALSGVETVLMVSAAEHPGPGRRSTAASSMARSAAGVGQLVYTSFVGADAGAMFTLGRDHHRTEEYIRASGLCRTRSCATTCTPTSSR